MHIHQNSETMENTYKSLHMYIHISKVDSKIKGSKVLMYYSIVYYSFINIYISIVGMFIHLKVMYHILIH